MKNEKNKKKSLNRLIEQDNDNLLNMTKPTATIEEKFKRFPSKNTINTHSTNINSKDEYATNISKFVINSLSSLELKADENNNSEDTEKINYQCILKPIEFTFDSNSNFISQNLEDDDGISFSFMDQRQEDRKIHLNDKINQSDVQDLDDDLNYSSPNLFTENYVTDSSPCFKFKSIHSFEVKKYF